MIRIRQILCPVDFSSFSRRALDHAAVLARWYQAELTLLHVPPLMPTMFAVQPGVTPMPGTSPLDPATVRAELAAFAGPLEPAPKIALREGAAASGILHHASESGADLIVMGTHGRTGFERFMLGSVTEKVVRSAPCPVLTVPAHAPGGGERPLFTHVLCGVDFSEASDRAVRYALSLAQEAKGKLTLLHVLEWLPDEWLARYPQIDMALFRRTTLADVRTRMERLVPAEARDWCEAEVRVADGKPYLEILRLAGAEGADLVVLGVHGRGPIDRMLFGSTAQHVVRQAACPVLTIRS